MSGKDIALIIEDNCFDIRLEDGDFIADDGLETVIITALFTDKRVRNDQLPDFATDKRGWWGDMVSEVDQDRIGSRLWTLARSKISNETLRLYEDYSREALQFLIEDGIANQIEVSASYNDNFHLILSINVRRPNKEETKFNLLWDNQSIEVLNKDRNNGI